MEQKEKAKSLLQNCSVMAIAFFVIGVIDLVGVFIPLIRTGVFYKTWIYITLFILSILYPVCMIMTSFGLVLKKDALVKTATIGQIVYFGMQLANKIRLIAVGAKSAYTEEVQRILSIFEIVSYLAMALICVYFLVNRSKIDQTYPEKKWFVVILLLMLAVLPSALTAGMTAVDQGGAVLAFTLLWSMLLKIIVTYAPYLFMGIDKTRCSFASLGNSWVKTFVVSLIVCLVAFILIRVPVSCSSRSSYGNSNQGGYGDPYPGESFSDYMKRVDPGLYQDIKDRYDSIQP